MKVVARRLIIPFTIIFMMPLAASAAPQTTTQAPPTQNGAGHVPPGSGVPPMMPVLGEIKGVVSWNTLAKVKQVRAKNKILPQFASEITALNATDVKVQGFMMPLEPGEKQKHFLVSLNPQTCSYCLPAGPEGVVEVKSTTPIKYTLEPIIVSGRMAILKDDPMGLYYRLTDATLAPK